eukprot:847892_1
MEVKEASDNIDETFYGDQLYMIDHKSMKQLKESSVLIAGLNGLGIEIAKNVILSGIGTVTIMDHNLVEMDDVSSNCFLTLDSIGTHTRASACIESLQSLNHHVAVHCIQKSKHRIAILDPVQEI